MTVMNTHNDGQLFGPTLSGKHYLSLNYHRSRTSTGGKKSLWDPNISRDTEYNIFCTADKKNWQDNKGDYWGIHNQAKTSLGTENEIICKFPHPTNQQDPWHGYPLHTYSARPSDDFVRKFWADTNEISRGMAKKIVKGLI
ncbi:hypothetical protein KDW_31210 [Dictyobacter vulcani]|uniref:Uncharacterized protein n=1 Tax=Dictyobacter vulcani TaxID=2607529 RepID=A0A5J4KS91_9CHLR|nr:hypothetical protein [Dictyobacter vulcani]GER88959.1 hypothetical protein KDW_31210 [Dictyobacter vulcani]